MVSGRSISPQAMPTYVLLIEYDGTGFCGWQRQANGSAVQAVIEEALGTVLRRSHIAITGSGRTDAGVHARGQVAHFRVDRRLDMNCNQLMRSLNGVLPNTVAIHHLVEGPDRFHARFDAVQRLYHYYISLAPVVLERGFRMHFKSALDFTRMNKAAAYLLGTHHFGAFCIARSSTTNRVCTMSRATWVPEPGMGHWRFEIEADRFLHGMVRAIVGTLFMIGRGSSEPQDMQRILASMDRRAAGPAASAHGLVLEQVRYRVPLFANMEERP